MASRVGVIVDLTRNDIDEYYEFLRKILKNKAINSLTFHSFLFKPVFAKTRLLYEDDKVSPPKDYVCLNVNSDYCYLAFKNDGSEFLFYDFNNMRYVRVRLCRDDPVCVDHALFVYRILWAWLNSGDHTYDSRIDKYKINANLLEKFIKILVKHFDALNLPIYPLALLMNKTYYWARVNGMDVHLGYEYYESAFKVVKTVSSIDIDLVKVVLDFLIKYNMVDRIREIVKDIAPEVFQYLSMIGLDPHNVSINDIEALIHYACYNYNDLSIIGGISSEKKAITYNNLLYSFKAKITSYSYIIDNQEFHDVEKVLDYIRSKEMVGEVKLRLRTDANIDYFTLPILKTISHKQIGIAEKIFRFTDTLAKGLIGKEIVNAVYPSYSIIFIEADKSFHLEEIPPSILLIKYFVSRGSR